MIDPQNCLVLTGYDHHMQAIGDLTAPTQKAYADKWGFSFFCNREYTADTHPAWQKLGLIRKNLMVYELVIWIDADVFITNPDVDIRNIADGHMGLTFSYDWEYTDPDLFTSCAFTVRSCPISFRFLDEAMKLTKYGEWNSITWDQQALREVRRRGGDFAQAVRVLPHRVLASVPSDVQKSVSPWKAGDFLCHLGGIPTPQRVVKFKKMNP